MNTGLGDAWNLAWKLALACQETAPRSLLLSYDAERLPVARAVVRETNLLTRLATLRYPFVRTLRDLMLPWLITTEPTRARLLETFSQIGFGYARSPIVVGDGRRAPNVRLRERASGMAGPLYGLLGTKHVLLLWARPKERIPEDATVLAGALARRYGNVLSVYAVESPSPIAPLVLVRPDGYLGFEGGHKDARALQDHLARTFFVAER